jgi:hypothetical protein
MKDVIGDQFRILMPFTAGALFSPVDQAQHPTSHKAARLFSNGRSLYGRFSTALNHWLGKQDNRANHLVAVLNWVDKTKSQLRKLLSGVHRSSSPSAASGMRAV